jgi:hypothetical protein
MPPTSPTPMKSMLTPRPRRRLLAVLTTVLSLNVLLLSAQTVGEKPKEEVVVMSPFTVQTNKDIGYEASRNLAGMGLNTKTVVLKAV